MLEIKHLKTMLTLSQQGSLSKTAIALSISQSALSHQIKELESKLDKQLFHRKKFPISFTCAGQKILALAQQTLPLIEQTESELLSKNINSGYSIGFACHACFQWLVPIINRIEQAYPSTNLAYHGELFSDSLNIDILFSDDKPPHCRYHYAELGKFEQLVAVNKHNPLAKLTKVLPEHIAQQTLLTYPLPAEQLDVFRRFLAPANIQPKNIRAVNNTLTMLQMINADHGVAVMPSWLVNAHQNLSEITAVPLGPNRLFKRLYIRIKPSIKNHLVIKRLVSEAQHEFRQMMSDK